MTDNNRVLLDAIIEQSKKAQASDYSDADYFELFTAENILKQEALSYDELESGLVGAGGDGGLDAAYFLIDGRLVREDTDPDDFKKKPNFEIYFVQAKRTGGFDESAIDKFISVTENLFDLGKDLSQFDKLYNEDVRTLFETFRNLYIALAGKHPRVKVTYFYATKGSTSEIHPNVKARVAEIEAALRRHFPEAEIDFQFAGSAELLRLARKRPPETLALPITELLAAASGGYVALTKLSDFNTFLRNDEGKAYGHIFDENVRAYQGSVEVNKGIRETLENPSDEDFWWLNNGITILAQEASQAGKSINISDPQVINGLQTSTEILGFFDANPDRTDDRHVMVKIVQSTSSATRDRVTKATNSQTGVQPASLRATDNIQRNIEEALGRVGLYYDRQKNFYKNEGKPLHRIIGIAEMAQTVMSVLLQRPNDARARPSSLIKEDPIYNQIFNEQFPIGLYVVAGEMKKSVDQHLREHTDLDSADKNNLHYHVLTRLAVRLTGEGKPSVPQLANLDRAQINNAVIDAAFSDILPIYKELGGDGRVAKGADFAARVRDLPLAAPTPEPESAVAASASAAAPE